MGKGFFQFGKGVLLRGPCRLFFSHRKGVPGHGKGVPGLSMTYVIRALLLSHNVSLQCTYVICIV